MEDQPEEATQRYPGLTGYQNQDAQMPAVTGKPESAIGGDQSDAVEEQSELTRPRPFQCPFCSSTFRRLEHQTRHIRTHTGEKPYACQFRGCSKSFSRSDELTRHTRTHDNVNPRRRRDQTQQDAMFSTTSTLMPSPSESRSYSISTSATDSPNSIEPTPNMPSSSGLPSSLDIQFQGDAGTPNWLRLSSDMNLPSTTDVQVERENMAEQDYYNSNRNPPPFLDDYAMSRSRSQDQQDPYDSQRHQKRRRRNTMSTTPEYPSQPPIFGLHTAPYEGSQHLPAIQNLSLKNLPTLPAIEPQQVEGQYNAVSQPSSTVRTGLKISDLISKTDHNQSQEPLPQLSNVAERRDSSYFESPR